MKIRPWTYNSGREGWMLDCGFIDGKRVRLTFEKKSDAEEELNRRKGLIRSHGLSALSLSEAERVRFIEARERLAAVGASIEQAIDHFIATRPTLKPALSLKELVEKCMFEKEHLGAREHYLRQLKCSWGSFLASRESRDAASITRDEIKAWVHGNQWAPKTQRNYLGDLRTLFSWAKDERYISSNPCADGDEIRLAAATEGEIEILSAGQCEKLLVTALAWHGRMWNKHLQRWEDGYRFQGLLGYLALAMFVGVRPEELTRSPRANLDLDAGSFLVLGAHAKTRTRRVIELPCAAIGWLQVWNTVCPGSSIIPANFKRLWADLRAEAEVTHWPHDVLRHTAASMHYAFYQDEARLKAMLGHSSKEDTLFHHYRGIRLPNGRTLMRSEAERFYSCVRPGLTTPEKE